MHAIRFRFYTKSAHPHPVHLEVPLPRAAPFQPVRPDTSHSWLPSIASPLANTTLCCRLP